MSRCATREAPYWFQYKAERCSAWRGFTRQVSIRLPHLECSLDSSRMRHVAGAVRCGLTRMVRASLTVRYERMPPVNKDQDDTQDPMPQWRLLITSPLYRYFRKEPLAQSDIARDIVPLCTKGTHKQARQESGQHARQILACQMTLAETLVVM